MFYDNFKQMPYDNDIDINITNQNVNTNTNSNMNMMGGFGEQMGMVSSPIMETPRERCVYRNVYHEVPHVC